MVALHNREQLGYSDADTTKWLIDAAEECWGKLKENWDSQTPYGPTGILGGVWNVKDPSHRLTEADIL
jgi:hypothetical protein